LLISAISSLNFLTRSATGCSILAVGTLICLTERTVRFSPSPEARREPNIGHISTACITPVVVTHKNRLRTAWRSLPKEWSAPFPELCDRLQRVTRPKLGAGRCFRALDGVFPRAVVHEAWQKTGDNDRPLPRLR
jgi:hypothetical protein